MIISEWVDKVLGWGVAPDEDFFEDNGVVRRYWTVGQMGDDPFLQVNELYSPAKYSGLTCLAVGAYAIGFNVCSGWFPVVAMNESVVPLVESTVELLQFANFADHERATKYATLHTECKRNGWNEVRDLSTPYAVLSSSAEIVWRKNQLPVMTLMYRWSWEQVMHILQEGHNK